MACKRKNGSSTLQDKLEAATRLATDRPFMPDYEQFCLLLEKKKTIEEAFQQLSDANKRYFKDSVDNVLFTINTALECNKTAPGAWWGPYWEHRPRDVVWTLGMSEEGGRLYFRGLLPHQKYQYITGKIVDIPKY